MYIYKHDGLGRDSTSTLSAPTERSLTDAQVLRQAAKLARSIYTAVRDIEQSIKFLATPAQQDLLSEIVAILRTFFPSGYGVIDTNGKVLKASTRSRTEVVAPSLPRNVPPYFHHDTWLFISYQKCDAAGRQRPFAPGHRNWIYFCAVNLNLNTAHLARVLIHEMIHMLGHRYRSIEEKFGARAAGEMPTKAAGALLNRSAFNPLRRVMEKHFLKLIAFLNRQPHRARNGPMAFLPDTVSTNWGTHLVEEILAHVLTDRATWALAQLHARRSGIGISQALVPIQFLKDYFRSYWLSEPRDRSALYTKEADAIFAGMEKDLEKLVQAVRQHVGP